MSEQPLIGDVGQGANQGVGWYGKLPSLGDFVGRRMPRALEAEWDNWVREGMDELRRLNPDSWQDAFVSAPVWFFLATGRSTANTVAMGAVAPSMDRVGRYYPLTILAASPYAGSTVADDTRLQTFFAGARAAIVDARRLGLSADELDERVSSLMPPFERRNSDVRKASLIDDILSDLSEASYAQQPAEEKVELPRGEWRDHLRDKDDYSVWWVSPTTRCGYRDLTHRGILTRGLFSLMFSKLTQSESTPASTLI